MASINYAQKEIACKVVYYGPGMCGKTTNLLHLHRSIDAEMRGELVALATPGEKTLFFDFLPISAANLYGFNTKFQLYTVPGQVTYNSTRRLVLRGVDGVVFVCDSQWDKLAENVESFLNLMENLSTYNYSLDSVPFVVQLNKRDLPNAAPVDFITYLLKRPPVPQFEAVATEGKGVFETLECVCRYVLAGLRRHEAVTATAADL
jgi:hypothetical protein